MNHIRTSIITRVRNHFGVAQQAPLLSQGFPPKSFLCPHSDWPDTSQSWSLKTWQKLGNNFATCFTASFHPLPRALTVFKRAKPLLIEFPAVAQEQHTRGADFRGAQICLDTGPDTAAVLFLTVPGHWGCRCGAWALCDLGGEFCHPRLVKTQFSQTPFVSVSLHQAEAYAPNIFILLYGGGRTQTFLNP